MTAVAPHERILVAVDTSDPARIRDLAEALRGRVGAFKLGLEAFTALGPGPVREIVGGGGAVFLDLKLHDIPNTVAGAAAAAGRLGVRYLTVHALGGAAMMRRAVEAARDGALEAGHEPPRVLAVTILTSHTDGDLEAAGVAGPCDAAVVRLATLAREAGVAGVVCSPLEVGAVRRAFRTGELVVPGIRPAGAARDDQARIATPASAIAAGADRLVIGRPITRATDPAAAADAIAAEIAGGV
jgi:orotidine-5'-phosphate decarboxylase